MSVIVCFPGVEVPAPLTDHEPDLEEVALAREILLERWEALGSELKRRVDGIPSDLRFELCETRT
jgi:hypothetical protein